MMQAPQGLKLERVYIRIQKDLMKIALAPYWDMPFARQRVVFTSIRDICQDSLDGLEGAEERMFKT